MRRYGLFLALFGGSVVQACDCRCWCGKSRGRRLTVTVLLPNPPEHKHRPICAAVLLVLHNLDRDPMRRRTKPGNKWGGGRAGLVGELHDTWGGGLIPVGSGTNKEARTCRHYYYSIRCTSCRVRHLKRSGVQGCLSGYGFLYWKFCWSNLSFVCW